MSLSQDKTRKFLKAKDYGTFGWQWCSFLVYYWRTMLIPRRLTWPTALAILALFTIGTFPLPAADKLIWNSDRVAAEISSWDLAKLLQTLAEKTGWQIYVEPDTDRLVSTKFKDRPQGEALRLLLGDLNFALLPPKANGPSRLLVFRTSIQDATKLVKAPEKKVSTAEPIANTLVITVKPGVNIDELAKKLGAKVTGRADKLNTYRLEFEDAEAAVKARKALEENPDVLSIENDFPVSRPPTPDSLTLSSFAPLDLKPRAATDGCGVVVGVIDTAVQRQGTGISDFMLSSIAVAGDSNPSDKQPTHGTSMSATVLRALAATAQGGSSSVRILPVDVYGERSSTSTFDVATGIYKAVNAGAQIINLSLGSDGNSPFLQKMIQNSHDQGVLFFAAAGNEPVGTPTYPAAYSEVIAVTAGTSKGVIAPYANFGDFVDVMAPGSSVVNFNGQSWLIMGTSASTAYASGAAASMLDQSCGTPRAQLEAQIRSALSFKRQ